MKLGMKFYVDYAHSIEGASRTEPKHGHTAKVIIELEGEVKGGEKLDDNVVMWFEDMREECEQVLDKIDHQDLNDRFQHPTAENITQWIFNELSERIPISRVTFYEGEGKWCTVERERKKLESK